MSDHIITIPTQELLLYFMILCRVGTMFLFVMPFSDPNIKPAVKIPIILMICTVVGWQVSESILPVIKSIGSNDAVLFLTIILEIALGICLGSIIKMLTTAVHVAGVTMATQMGLSNAALFDNAHQTQNTVIGNMLSLVTILLIIESGIHIYVINAVSKSYDIIPIGHLSQNYNNFVQIILHSVSKMWSAGIQMAIPFMLINIVIMVGAGVLAKLMPQFQVFFIMMPAQIGIGIMFLGITMSGITLWFMEFFSSELSSLFS
jgi:flagellar biosynthetic protein FliR